MDGTRHYHALRAKAWPLTRPETRHLTANESIHIGQLGVGAGQAPIFIAELSGNHNGSLERALEIVDAVADAGAHILKLQTYTPDSLTMDVDLPQYRVDDPGSPWDGRHLHELYADAMTPWDWHGPIFERARALGMEVMSSPFDGAAVEFLESLDVAAYKIASFENRDDALIRACAETGKPLIISTGLATLGEIEHAAGVARSAGCDDLIVLKCTSQYPASPTGANLATIPHLRAALDCPIGQSYDSYNGDFIEDQSAESPENAATHEMHKVKIA